MSSTAILDSVTQTFALDGILPGERCTVSAVEEGACLCQLRCLGVAEGAELELIRRVSGGRLLIVRVDGADVAVRREVAATIQVRKRSGSDEQA